MEITMHGGRPGRRPPILLSFPCAMPASVKCAGSAQGRRGANLKARV